MLRISRPTKNYNNKFPKSHKNIDKLNDGCSITFPIIHKVTIEGQCVLLQISIQIKMLSFLLNSQNHRMNHIFPGIILNP